MWIAYAFILAAVLYLGPAGGLSHFVADSHEQHQQAYAESTAQVAVNMLAAGVAHQRQNPGFSGWLNPSAAEIPAWLRQRAGDVKVLLVATGQPNSGVYVFGIRQDTGVRGHIDRMADENVVMASYGGPKLRGAAGLPQQLPAQLRSYFMQQNGNHNVSPLYLFAKQP